MSSILPKNELENSNFCPSLLGQKFFVRFLGELKKPRSPFEINWPLGRQVGLKVFFGVHWSGSSKSSPASYILGVVFGQNGGSWQACAFYVNVPIWWRSLLDEKSRPVQLCHKWRPCLFILILSWFYPNFIQIKSG